MKKKDRTKPKATIRVQPKLSQVNEILDTLRDRKTVKETSMKEALAKTGDDKAEADMSRKLLEKTQKKYDEIKGESLKIVNAPTRTKDKIKNDLEKIMSGNEIF